MFKRGDIVKIVRGYWGSINDPEVGKIGIVTDSLNDFGNIRYELVEYETGHSSAWWYEDRLEFVSEGSEDDIHKCLEKRKVG